ncbi:hypothetical protein BKA82DRAFT_15700 [Pisolithus tinctorius]|uniref:Uncharacterized protein n=1 Tax=Pisolithus tinctorius Marx 270 TaxID=870435 RepID=A0A0C3K1K2_PISTI|nr:hypothetical protein BKA82DRAFT_15700 [Pisolithus tinctorius]KIO03407.1 hypothetical protein M404DRAFT_15700 [Pisolithus tinctorius Marx 270]
MTELIRSAKSGNDWTSHELAAYNIVVEYQNAATFGTDNLPQPTVNPAILTATLPDDAADDGDYYLLRSMDLAMSPAPAEESAVDDFAVLLLRALGYTPRGRVVRTRKVIPLIICGEARHVKTDEDKRHLDSSDPEPQLIAEAIAAFAANNQTRQRTLNQPPLNSKVMAGITMKGTAPIFYKILVTAALAGSVASGVYPQVATTVYAHVPNVPRPNRRWREGMQPLDNRQVILSCYEAFRQFVN